jgi:hypothetical protein
MENASSMELCTEFCGCSSRSVSKVGVEGSQEHGTYLVGLIRGGLFAFATNL